MPSRRLKTRSVKREGPSLSWIMQAKDEDNDKPSSVPPDDGSAVRAFLSDPGSYPHRPRRVKVIETHSALVFLASPYVYKIKKPVDLGFLDFSTLAKRRHYCQREIELNERLCHGVYLELAEIKRRGRQLSLGGRGKTVEYAVVMKQLSERHFLNRLLERNAVTRADLDRVVAKLTRFYETQHPTAEVESWGRISKLKISTDENFEQTRKFIGATLSKIAWTTLSRYTNEFYRRRRDLFESRIQDQWVRDCHGDLHSEHIHLTRRSLHIYDCIEFNDRFRYVDVASDVAFLAMDLDYQGRPDLSRYFVHAMAESLGDPGMLELMDFYKCYRAYVRGKVESLQSQNRVTSDEDRPRHTDRAGRYFRQSLGYTVAGSRPFVLAVMGGVACGKSTLARALGEELGWKVFSSDAIRKKAAGLSLTKRTPRGERARLYSARRTRQTYDDLMSLAEQETKEGRGVIVDATFARRSQRARLLQRFKGQQTTVRFVEAQAKPSIIRKRLRRRERATEVVSDARMEDYGKLSARYEPPVELPAARRVVVDTSGSLNDALADALRALARPGKTPGA